MLYGHLTGSSHAAVNQGIMPYTARLRRRTIWEYHVSPQHVYYTCLQQDVLCAVSCAPDVAGVTRVMEVDHVTYIFGSFSRRRQHHHDVAAPKRHTNRRLSETQVSTIAPENYDCIFVCSLCEQQYNEPRVLPCLHTFCTPCLQQLEKEDPGFLHVICDIVNAASRSQLTSNGRIEGRWTSVVNDRRPLDVSCERLCCPTCGNKTILPPGGVTALPPHYILQHHMVLDTLNKQTTTVLCDLCSNHSTASSRCMECLLSLCTFCAEAHLRQRSTASHEVLELHEARQRGITQVARQAMCPTHPDLELQLFCAPCGQVVCRQCCQLTHRGHPCDPASRAAQTFSRSLRECLERTRPLADEAVVSLDTLRQLVQNIQERCSEVQQQVDQYIDSYIAALEEHRRHLQQQVQEAREAKLRAVHIQQEELQRHSEDTRTAICFAQQLLTEASDIELLSLVTPVLRRLECLCRVRNREKVNQHTVYGVITTQTVSPAHCNLSGLHSLQDVRQQQKVETVLVTRDADKQPLCHGGEKVTAELRYRDTSRRKIPVQLTDRRDGTYLISFVPDTAGNLSLFVSVQEKPIQGSPFHVCVRTMRPHQGTFHCCSFCSSGRVTKMPRLWLWRQDAWWIQRLWARPCWSSWAQTLVVLWVTFYTTLNVDDPTLLSTSSHCKTFTDPPTSTVL
ncbi:hypothetical protein L9F63_026918 [Diploptera punctata]|uniref:Tripartite motif-containing protein 45 n=1 Tax=Diploptera punctata TaxID=6984 RepID=A0AAD8EP09_DIPPU|nr:hypothetical protein L9F63_026918 [Diploptera punctata]